MVRQSNEACEPDTSGHCERSESGAPEDCSWYFCFGRDFMMEHLILENSDISYDLER